MLQIRIKVGAFSVTYLLADVGIDVLCAGRKEETWTPGQNKMKQ